MKHIENLLRKTMGLDAASIGSGLIQRSVRLRMKLLGLVDVEEFTRLLESSEIELWQFIESVIVTETWFFRDRDPFAAFVRLVLEEWLPAHPTGLLRLLSLPCSSGEEPYSMAMALLDAGVPSERFQIDAADISSHALAQARRGIYSKNSFRGHDLAFRNQYFEQTTEGFALKESVRNSVHFLKANLISDEFMTGAGTYHFIFCRNLLIYFDGSSQRKAVQKIERLLAGSGYLFVGPAEQPVMFELGFVSANIPMAFACRKAKPFELETHHHPQPGKPFDLYHTSQIGSPQPYPHMNQPERASQAVANESSVGGEADLQRARRLADAGRLAEASAICEAHLLERGASAYAYHLLGLVSDARGQSGAIEYYRKALYLDPNHYDTLMQMALLSQKNGDLPRARTFRDRAQRLKAKTIPEAKIIEKTDLKKTTSINSSATIPTPGAELFRGTTET